MNRVDGARVSDILQAPAATSDPGFFKSPEVGVDGTQVPADWCNGIQEEIAYVIENNSLTLDKTDNTLLQQGIDASINTIVASKIIDTTLELYLATTGNDTTGDGTSGTPWLTLQKALDYLTDIHIVSGGLVNINIAAGTYTTWAATTIDHPDGDKIEIIGSGKATCHIQSTVSGGQLFWIKTDTSFDGIDIIDSYIALGEPHTLKLNSISFSADTVSTYGIRAENGGHLYLSGVDFVDKSNSCVLATLCDIFITGAAMTMSGCTAGLILNTCSVYDIVGITATTTDQIIYAKNCQLDLDDLSLVTQTGATRAIELEECIGSINSYILGSTSSTGQGGLVATNSKITITGSAQSDNGSLEGVLAIASDLHYLGDATSDVNQTGIKAFQNSNIFIETSTTASNNSSYGLWAYTNSRIICKGTVTLTNNTTYGINAGVMSHTSTPTGWTASGNGTDASPARITGNIISYGNNLAYNYHL